MNLDIVDPTNYAGWDELLLSTPGNSFFHTSSWARVLKEAYGYTPKYFTEFVNGRISTLIPIMEVDSFLTGRRGVSLPFTDYCEPIIDKDKDFAGLFNSLIEYGKKHGWKYIELRGGDKYLRRQESGGRRQEAGSSNMNPDPWDLYPPTARLAPFPSKKYFGHTLDLTGGEEKILSSLRDSTRRNIKKAAAQGVEVNISNHPDGVKEFYRLNCLTRKEHGLPPQPYYFFQKIYDHILSRDLGSIALASYKGRNIAGDVFFHFGDKGIYKYGASDKKYQDLRANNLLMWEGIKRSCAKGNKSFCFGRTELKNAGLRQFKTGWGGEEYTLNYFKYDFRKNEFIKDSLEFKNIYHYVFKKMPAPLSNIVGSSLYRHVG
jgi:hypothetical protein